MSPPCDSRIFENGHSRNRFLCRQQRHWTRSVWVSLPDRFPGVQLDDFVFMPNHFHGLITIYEQMNITSMPNRFRDQKQAMIEEQNPQLKGPYNRPKLGQIIRTFKAASTHCIRVSGGHSFAWQDNYWEEVVSKDDRFNILRSYIRDNPRRWEKDKLYKQAS